MSIGEWEGIGTEDHALSSESQEKEDVFQGRARSELKDWLCELVQRMKDLGHEPKANTSGIGTGQEQPSSEWAHSLVRTSVKPEKEMRGQDTEPEQQALKSFRLDMKTADLGAVGGGGKKEIHPSGLSQGDCPALPHLCK